MGKTLIDSLHIRLKIHHKGRPRGTKRSKECNSLRFFHNWEEKLGGWAKVGIGLIGVRLRAGRTRTRPLLIGISKGKGCREGRIG